MKECCWCLGEYNPVVLGHDQYGNAIMTATCSLLCEMASTVETVSKWNRHRRRRLLTTIWTQDAVHIYMEALAKGVIPKKGSRQGARILQVS